MDMRDLLIRMPEAQGHSYVHIRQIMSAHITIITIYTVTIPVG